MGQVPGSDGYPPAPPRGRVPLGDAFLTQIYDFSKESFLRSSPRGILLWRSPEEGGLLAQSNFYLKGSVCHIVS